MFHYVALLGPTASGKTKLAIEMAKKYPIEIISVDSVSVYRGLDIGSAKPSIEERDGVVHHLIDVVDLHEVYTVARFVEEANQLITQIRKRGCVPLLCGGTMMYAHALKEGMCDMPDVDPKIKNEVEQQYLKDGIASLYAALEVEDKAAALKLKPNDKQRIMRALSLVRTHHKPLHVLQSTSEPLYTGCFVLQCIEDRLSHRELLAKRVDQMFSQGFEEEVRGLICQYGADIGQHAAMRSIGYRQIVEHLCEKNALSDVRQKIITASAQLVKKQMTWINGFKSEFNHKVAPVYADTALETSISKALESMIL